jgi:hypothetical protein
MDRARTALKKDKTQQTYDVLLLLPSLFSILGHSMFQCIKLVYVTYKYPANILSEVIIPSHRIAASSSLTPAITTACSIFERLSAKNCLRCSFISKSKKKNSFYVSLLESNSHT